MKLFGKSRDRAIDTLLRAHLSRHSGECPEFDPDLSSAYVEHRLTTGVRSRYEEHLSGCAACRKQVVALSRLAAPETKLARPNSVGLREVFGALSRPRWALAVTAVIVIVISLPLLLSRSRYQVTERASSSAAGEPASEAAPTAAPSAQEKPSQASVAAYAKPHEERNQKNSFSSSKKIQAPTGAGSQEKLEARSDSQSTDEVKEKSETQSASQIAAAAAPESQEAKSEADRGRHQQQKDSAQGNESKGRTKEASDKETVQVTAAPAAPRPAPKAKVLKPPAGKLALRDNATSESVRPAERKILNKRFLWKEDAWTDKDFDPDKGLPMVTIIRDSNVYNEVLNKRAGLKPYLTGFSETDRAIIVYKGTVYKLIPQQSEK